MADCSLAARPWAICPFLTQKRASRFPSGGTKERLRQHQVRPRPGHRLKAPERLITTHYVNRAYSAKPVNAQEVDVAFQMDGDHAMHSYSAWLDNVTLRAW